MSDPEIVGSPTNYPTTYDRVAWSTNAKKAKGFSDVAKRRGGADKYGLSSFRRHVVPGGEPVAVSAEQQLASRQAVHAVTPSSPAQDPSPENPSNTASAGEPRQQPQSPIATQRSVTQDESEVSSLNAHLHRSTISPDRHGTLSATQTQRSTASNKRTTDQMQGTDIVSQSNSRPAKQPFSPATNRTTPMFQPNSPSQTHGPMRRSTANDTTSPTLSNPGIAGHYHTINMASHESTKTPATASTLSPVGSATTDTVLMKQPATRPITEQQLINEVKGIYAGLVMVERKCVDIIDQQNKSNKRLTDQQWKALVALHRTLLQEHHDFFSASQHPTASDNLKRLAIKYAMPARMWRHGIHSFLELLRHRLPDSMEHMLSFIYLAYSMMALLKESVPGFVETWIECLGDLARYRMAIEDTDPRDREIWSNVAKMWYNEAADKSPNVGRIQHHLAVLARPNIVEQLFYYDKALVSVSPFTNARESIMLLFDIFLKNKNNEAVQSRYPPAEYSFVDFNANLFTRQARKECDNRIEHFRNTFGGHIDRTGAKFKMQGPQMAASAFAGLLDFGKEDAYLWRLLSQASDETDTRGRAQDATHDKVLASDFQGIQALQRENWSKLTFDTQVDRAPLRQRYQGYHSFESSDAVVSYAATFTFEIISLVAPRMGDKNSVPFMHVVLANVYGMSFVAGALTYVEACIPWTAIMVFLNTIGRSGISYANIESDTFPPSYGGYGRQLPEDFLMRGMITTQHYYPPGFFAGSLVDEDERAIELPSHQAPRAERCLWLGFQLSKLGRYLTYDPVSKMFETTEFARSLATAYV